jgi:hypothetical protein
VRFLLRRIIAHVVAILGVGLANILLLRQQLVRLGGLNLEAIAKNNSVELINAGKPQILVAPSHALLAPVRVMLKIQALAGPVILQMVVQVDFGA